MTNLGQFKGAITSKKYFFERKVFQAKFKVYIVKVLQ
jgi:hypothetical protein